MRLAGKAEMTMKIVTLIIVQLANHKAQIVGQTETHTGHKQGSAGPAFVVWEKMLKLDGTRTRIVLVPKVGWDRDKNNFGPERGIDRDQILSSSIVGTGKGPCSVPRLGPGRESRRVLATCRQIKR